MNRHLSTLLHRRDEAASRAPDESFWLGGEAMVAPAWCFDLRDGVDARPAQRRDDCADPDWHAL